ncbi:SGNH/GDSL hydrolase family protein [Rhizobium halophilum]|uniref:SGNH/GDSL hydrolase family protein n=1 Tax=Rhizobium halophilum TaxID=2846852 RepID=UPI001EFCAAEC|nr:SGNH/GDSL hydrolase family protein [Rhizobium halophilum]MCF6370915.1 SGNH/GDSL hydrolase family protein [Rhizobium halophilum]
MVHVVLIGDSILDNAAYVPRGGDVAFILMKQLGDGQVTLLARDGAVIEDAIGQLNSVPDGATFLVVSAGGNDALQSIGVLLESVRTVAEALEKVRVIRDRFRDRYRTLLNEVGRYDRPTAICTIYDVMLPDLQQRRIANLALGVLNDVIIREAARRGLPLIDLRVMFSQERHYANAIEPSEQGSELIAAAVVEAMHKAPSGRSTIHTGL